MNLLKIIFPIINADSSYPSQLGFQEPATPVMEGIINFHNDLMFFIILIAIFVSFLLARCLYFFDKKKSKKSLNVTHVTTLEIIWTVTPAFILMLIAVLVLSLLYSSSLEYNNFLSINYGFYGFFFGINSSYLFILKKNLKKFIRILLLSTIILATPILVKVLVNHINPISFLDYNPVPYEGGSLFNTNIKYKISGFINDFGRVLFMTVANFNIECSKIFNSFPQKVENIEAFEVLRATQRSWVDSIYIQQLNQYSPIVKKELFINFINTTTNPTFVERFTGQHVYNVFGPGDRMSMRLLYPCDNPYGYKDWIDVIKRLSDVFLYPGGKSGINYKLHQLTLECHSSLFSIEDPNTINQIQNGLSAPNNKVLILFIGISFLSSAIFITNYYI